MPAAAEQSGDRQRREKGPPILTAEKGEHERAPNVSDSYPTPLRATLRAPPSKWAIKAFFRRVSAASRGRGQPRRGYRRPKPTARSDVGRLRSRRAAGFLLRTFLSPSKEKCERPMRRQVPLPRRSRRVLPHHGKGYAPAGAPKGFPLALWKPSGTEVGEKPVDGKSCFHARVGVQRHKQGCFSPKQNRRLQKPHTCGHKKSHPGPSGFYPLPSPA